MNAAARMFGEPLIVRERSQKNKENDDLHLPEQKTIFKFSWTTKHRLERICVKLDHRGLAPADLRARHFFIMACTAGSVACFKIFVGLHNRGHGQLAFDLGSALGYFCLGP